MRVIFRESDHTYWLGDKQLISVTQLLKKHGLSTNYSHVNATLMEKSANRGELIHKEIEDYIKNGTVGFTPELADYIEITEELGFVPDYCEIILPNRDLTAEEADNCIYAGRVDIIGHCGEETVIIDVKTTARADKRSGAWQLSLYERQWGEKFAKMYILHLCEKSKAIPIERISDAEIDRLLECERNGEIYSEPGLIVPTALLSQVEAAELTLKEAEAAKTAAETAAKELRAQLYEAMTKQGISSWETLDKSMLITRVAPSTKTTIDSKKLKEDMPEVAEKYSKTSTTAGYVKITVRGA